MRICGNGRGSRLQLQPRLLQVIAVQMQITERVHERSRLEARDLRHHQREQRVRRDVERHAEEEVGAALVELAAQFPSCTKNWNIA
jgi:hypothetical protein